MKFIDEILNKCKHKKISNHSSGGAFIIRSNSKIFGVELVNEILTKQSSKNVVYYIKKDGEYVNRGDALISVRGSYDELLHVKDICQYYLSYLCSIANTLDKYQQEIKDLPAQIFFKENLQPGIGEYFNQGISLLGGKIIFKDTNYLSTDIWKKEERYDIIKNLEDDTFLEVSNLEEYDHAIQSLCTHIICVNFSLDDLEQVLANKQNKKIGLKTNLTLGNIRSYANKGLDFVLIDNFYSNIKHIDVQFKYFDE